MNKIDKIKAQLKGPERTEAITQLPSLTIEELEQLFAELLFLASFVHGQLQQVRSTILRIPKEWILEHIEQESEPLLKNGTYEEYRRLLELYLSLNAELTRKLAERAAANSDPDIKEVGDDFLEKLKL